MIRTTKLNHGLDYFYRIHTDRLMELAHNGLSSLQQYLSDVSVSCHKDIFQSGPRSSSLRFDLGIETQEVEGHKISKLAGLAAGNYLGTPHDKVQACALDTDQNSICVEVPIWLKQNDLVGVPVRQEILNRIFTDGEVLTGHIDLLAIDGNSVWVWDFKPNAHKERYASTQVFFYALMLAKRTKLSLEKFKCGYFDEKRAYLFKPDLSVLK
tara:strand:+ start:1055 stop:1687 length:633 start_codon:yes stop_codon:yes gene_type:complete